MTDHVCSAVIAPPSDGKISEQNDEFPVDIKLPVKHVLSRELQVCDILSAIFFPICFRSAVVYSLSLFFSSPLQLYFDKITDLTMRRSDSVLFKEALVSLATDSGLHPLIPYFTYFIADEVMAS